MKEENRSFKDRSTPPRQAQGERRPPAGERPIRRETSTAPKGTRSGQGPQRPPQRRDAQPSRPTAGNTSRPRRPAADGTGNRGERIPAQNERRRPAAHSDNPPDNTPRRRNEESYVFSRSLSETRDRILTERRERLEDARKFRREDVKDKLIKEHGGEFNATPEIGTPAKGGAPARGKLTEALDALMVLGYQRAEATQVLKSMPTEQMTLEEIIRQALKKLM